ncbi:restriction endonuclease subunit S [Modestobacter lacusdianchii]
MAVPLKRLVDPARPITYGIVQAGEDVADGVPYIRPVDMDGHRGVNPSALRTTSVDIAAAYARSSLKPGDVVVSIGPSFGKTMVVPKELDGANLTQGTARVAVRSDVYTRYVVWALQSQTSVDFWESSIGGATFRALNLGPLAETPILLPARDEQRAIADYLDRETARIDTLIDEQQRLIVMLRERRVATVAEALEGYDRTTLRRLVDRQRPMTYGILQAGEPIDGGVPYIGPSDITGEGTSPKREALRTTSAEIASAYRRSVLAGGDVVVSIGPAYGKVAVVSDALAGANLTQDTVRVALVPQLADTRFVVWALLSRQTADYWDYQIMGATFRRLNLGTLARTPIPLVPLDEQRRIADYLDERTAKIDALIGETERFIELARERRSALITAAVTGQIDVRAVA